MKPVKLSELVEAVEFDSDEYGNWVDLCHEAIRSAPAEANEVPIVDDAGPKPKP